MEFLKSIKIAASGMLAQSGRMRVIAENLANSNSTANRPGEDPYRRKVPTFQNVMDRELGANRVEMSKVVRDKSEFGKRYDPGHPAADANGYIRTPNVKTTLEMMDMREAQRSFEANLNVIETSRSMMSRTIDLLRR
jgi:flagellar basal-body rod protein FlgC